MKLNFVVQIIVSQLEHLYESKGTYGEYDMVYDFLQSEGRDFEQSEELKKKLWGVAKEKFSKQEQKLIHSETYPQDKKMKILERYYKTELVAEYLLRVDRETNQRLDILDENGNKIKLLKWKPY